MAESPLSALVEGYVQAQDQKLKKAREIAGQQADKFEREFKVSQAKQQAQYQAGELQIRQKEADTQALFATIRDRAEKETERKNKEAQDIAKFRAQQQAKHWSDQSALKDAQSITAAALRGQQDYLKKFPDMAASDALDAAYEDLYVVRNRMFQQGQPQQVVQPQQAQQPPAAQPAPPQGTGILAGTGNPLAALVPGMGQQPQNGQPGGTPLTGLVPPTEPSGDRHNPSPVSQAQLELLVKRKDAEEALTKQREAQAHVLEITADATKALKSAEADKYRAQADKAKVDARQAVEKGQAEIGLLRARSAAELVRADNLRNEISVRSGRLALDRREAELSLRDPSKRNKGIIDLQNRVATWNNDQERLQKQVGVEIEQISKLHVILDPGILEAQKDPKTKKPLYDHATIMTMRDGAAAAMAHHIAMKDSLVVKINELQEFVDSAQKALSESGVLKETTTGGKPVGGPSSRFGGGDKKPKRKAPVRPVAVIPPGAPVPPGAQPGLYTRQGFLSSLYIQPSAPSRAQAGPTRKTAVRPAAKSTTKVPVRKGAKGKTKSGVTFEIIGVKE